MKEFFGVIFNGFLFMGGIALTIWSFFKWLNIGFRLEPKYYTGNQDGNFFMIMFFIGIAAVAYALGEIPKYKKRPYTNK